MKTIIYTAIVLCLLGSAVLGQDTSSSSSSSDGTTYFNIGNTTYKTQKDDTLFSGCRGIIRQEYFDLTDFSNVSAPTNVTIFGTDYNLFFQLCAVVSQSKTTCQRVQNGGNYSVLVGFSDAGKSEVCEPIGEVYTGSSKSSANFKIAEIKLNETNEAKGVQVTFSSNDTDTLVLRLICPNDKSSSPPFQQISATVDQGVYIVEANSTQACYLYSGQQLELFIEKFQYIFIGVGFVVGLVVCLFGFYLWKPTLYLFGTVGAGLPLLVFLFIFCLPEEPLYWLYWIYFGISLVVGLIVGFLIMKLEKVGVCIGGGLLGFFVATILEVTVISSLNLSVDPLLIYYGLIAVLAIIGVLLAYALHDHILIASTAFCGSYGAFWSVGLLLGGFPNPMEIASEYHENGEISVDAVTYVYAVATVALSFLGVYLQYSIRRKHKAKKELEGKEAPTSGPDYYKYNTAS